MSAHGEESAIQRFTAGAAHRRDQIVSVLRFEGPDFDPLAVAQFLNSRIVGWLDQDRTSLMYSQPPGDFRNDQTSTCILNEPAWPQQIESSNLEPPPVSNFDLDQTSRPHTSYRDWRIRGTHDPKSLGLACRVMSLFHRFLITIDEREGEM